MFNRLFVRLFIFFIVFSLSENTVSYWSAAKTEEGLIKESNVIVYAQYQGESAIEIADKEFQMNLGVLRPIQLLKGKVSSELIFIKRYNKNVPLSSDMFFFKPGQSGLWFLKAIPGSTGLYQMTHPSHYKNISYDSHELKLWQKKMK